MINGYSIGNVGILFNDAAKWNHRKPLLNKKSLKSYSIFARRARKHGLNIFMADYREYRKGGILRKAWGYDKGKWQKIASQEIDLIYSRFNRAMFEDHKKKEYVEKLKYLMWEDLRVINHPLLEEFCWDKHLVSELFPESAPKTFLVNTKSGLKTVLSDIKTEKVVLKPRYGTLGKDVLIVDKNDLPKNIKKNTLVQEWIDTSNGIKRVMKKSHDLRIIVVNGEIDHAHIRIPKKGKLAANLALGGRKKFITNGQIPKKVRAVVKKVDRLFKNYKPRIYSIDFLIDEKQRPYIVECNSQPMINRYAFGTYSRLEFYDAMFNAMKTGIKIKIVETIR